MDQKDSPWSFGGGKKHVINRHGERVPLQFDRITDRMLSLMSSQSPEAPENGALHESLDPATITADITRGIPHDMTTTEIDTMAAQACHFASTRHPDYDRLASRLVTSNNQKQMKLSFSEHVAELHARGLVRQAAHEYVQEHRQLLDAAIQHHRDGLLSYFGWKTLRRSYLHKIPTGKKNDKGEPIMKVYDTPQFLWMREALEVSDVPATEHKPIDVAELPPPPPPPVVPPEWQAVQAGLVDSLLQAEVKSDSAPLDRENVVKQVAALINKLLAEQQQQSIRQTAPLPAAADKEKVWTWGSPDIQMVVANYHALSRMWFTHASPTLFHSLMQRNGLSSCFLLPPISDALTAGDFSIYQFLAKCAAISAVAGGIGFNASGIRCAGRPIKGSNGTSNGLIPMLRVFNASACYVDQGGQKRPGAMAIYLEPWHGEIFEFLAMKSAEGEEKKKCFDLHYGMWIPDIFMRRLENGGMWSLMSPDECPGLVESYGAEFDALYERYEREGKVMRQIPAKQLWTAIIKAQPATGSPYMLSKDASNRKSNQKNLGTIKSSNLCVAPETLILVENQGYVPIASVAKGTPTSVWNGERYSDVQVLQTSATPALLYTVTTEQGVSVDVSPYHFFPIVFANEDGATGIGKEVVKMIPANELKPGMRLQAVTCWPAAATQAVDVVDDEKVLDGLAKAGKLVGQAGMWLHNPKAALFTVEDLAGRSQLLSIGTPEEWQASQHVPFTTVQNPRQATVWWSGVAQTHGSLIVPNPSLASAPTVDKDKAYLIVPTLSQQLAQQWCLFLQDRLGIFDWEIQRDMIRSTETHRRVFKVKVGYVGLRKLVSLGFDIQSLDTHRHLHGVAEDSSLDYLVALCSPRAAELAIGQIEPVDKAPAAIIQSIEIADRKDFTYCFDEPHRHLAVFNGLLLGNCTEILEFTSPDEIAVCNLASYSVPTALRADVDFPKAADEDEARDGYFAPPPLAPSERAQLLRQYPSKPDVKADLMLVYRTVTRMVRNLNRVIDVGYYPVHEAENSNRRHRPIGIGLQGLADLFIAMRLPFTSREAMELNEAIAATMYYAACRTSMLLAKRDGTYSTFHYNGGCPMSKGEFQFDMWDKNGPTKLLPWDWEALRQDIMKYGMRNSLLVAPMPTAGTSQIMDKNEAFYPYLHLYYTRNTAAGKFPIIQRQLLLDLLSLGMWDMKMKQRLIAAGGTIQTIPGLPAWMYEVYRTWDEQPRDKLLEMCYQRARYVDQGQSMNIRQPAEKGLLEKLTNYYFRCWRLGMKNWSYYFKSSAPMEANQSTLDSDLFAATSALSSVGATTHDHSVPPQPPTPTAAHSTLASSLPGPLKLSPSPSTAYVGGHLDALIDAAVASVSAQSNEDDDLHRLSANMALLKAACSEEDGGDVLTQLKQHTKQAPECVFECGS